MSGTRATIARLSLVLRIALYAALLTGIGYIGFSFSAGYIAVPGDLAFEVLSAGPGSPGPLEGDMLYLRTACQPGAGPECAPPPPFAFRAFGAGRPGTVIDLADNGVEVMVERDRFGPDAKGRISVTRGGATLTREFTGPEPPAEVIKDIPDPLKSRLAEALAHPAPAPPVPDIFFERLPLPAGPASQPAPPDAAPSGSGAAGGGATANGPPPPLGDSGGGSPPIPGPGASSGGAPATAVPPQFRTRMFRFTGPALLQQQVSGHTAIRATLVGITIALSVLAIIQLERLLAHFQAAELFSTRNTALLRNIGLLLIGVAIVQGVVTLLPALLAGVFHPVLFGALGPHLFLVFAGLGLCLLAQVMAEAVRLEDEAAHTV